MSGTSQSRSSFLHQKISDFQNRRLQFSRPLRAAFQPPQHPIPSYTWSSFSISEHIFTGTWNDQPYRATIYLRLLCTANPSQRLARFVITLNRADQLHTDEQHVHAVAPKTLLKDDKLPEPYLQLLGTNGNASQIPVKVNYWHDLATAEWQNSAVTGHVLLNSSAWYTLHMAGSPYSYSIPASTCSSTHPLFPTGGAWLALVDSMVKQRSMPNFKFLLMGHLNYHLKLGLQGMLFVCLPETEAALLEYAEVKEAVAAQQLVLLPWESALARDVPYMMQVPGNNLLKLAAAGSGAFLAFWDLDEYLVLPRHRPISHEITRGCLTQLSDPAELETVIYSTWTYNSKAEAPDLRTWLTHGGMLRAVQRINYTARPYTHCNWGILCKSIINPNAEYNMHVHQMVRPPPESVHRTPVSRDCAYLHHFFQLFKLRPFWDQGAVGPVQPLVLSDLPQ